MKYKVQAEEQIWFLTTYEVEADSPEEAEEIVASGEAAIIIDREEKELHNVDVLDVEELW